MKVLSILTGFLFFIRLITAADSLEVSQLILKPVIDCQKDNIYGPKNFIGVYDTGFTPPYTENNLSAYFICGWKDDSLYFLVDVTDDTVYTGGEDWVNDHVTFYFDGNNSKGTMYDTVDDISIPFQVGDTADVIICPEPCPPPLDGSVNFKTIAKENPSGYILEAAFSLENLHLVGDENHYFGFDIEVSDTDSEDRETIMRWHGSSNEAWHCAHLFGNAILIETYFQPSELSPENIHTGDMPEIYMLSQNYPNPFNPVTSIRYGLPKAAYVELVVYNLLGQQVATLVNEGKHAGFHRVDFNAGDLPGGMYIYWMKAGGFTRSMKMLLLK